MYESGNVRKQKEFFQLFIHEPRLDVFKENRSKTSVERQGAFWSLGPTALKPTDKTFQASVRNLNRFSTFQRAQSPASFEDEER